MDDKEIMVYRHGTKVDFRNAAILTSEVEHFAGRDFVSLPSPGRPTRASSAVSSASMSKERGIPALVLTMSCRFWPVIRLPRKLISSPAASAGMTALLAHPAATAILPRIFELLEIAVFEKMDGLVNHFVVFHQKRVTHRYSEMIRHAFELGRLHRHLAVVRIGKHGR